MKKLILALLALVVVVVLLVILGRGGWETYENSRYGFLLDYPSGWELGIPETNGAGRVLVDSSTGVECYAYGFANALLNEDGDPQTLDQFIDWLTDVGDGLEVLEREPIRVNGHDGVRLLTRDFEDRFRESFYALGREEGIGLFCGYDDIDQRESYREVFLSLLGRFRPAADLDGSVARSGLEECSNLLSGAVEPLRDRDSFSDRNYTEVATTSADDWDRSRLPERVLTLEDHGYDCLPLPVEFDDSDGGDMPAVNEIEWQCELRYEDWQYLDETDISGVEDLRQQNYACEAEICQANGSESSVWRCGR